MSVDMDSNSSNHDQSPPPAISPPASRHSPPTPQHYPSRETIKMTSPVSSPHDSYSPSSSPPNLPPPIISTNRPQIHKTYLPQLPRLKHHFPPPLERDPWTSRYDKDKLFMGDPQRSVMDDPEFVRSLSPPPFSSTDPTANECKMVDYRGKKIAAFIIMGKTMLCLPQAFELFLKHLVGGHHTVYCKLKRLGIAPIVCNVDQIRTLRGVGAIQPGVNRVKLLSDSEMDELYRDCVTARPGRPPKRGIPFPSMSPQEAILHHNKNMALQNGENFRDLGPMVTKGNIDPELQRQNLRDSRLPNYLDSRMAAAQLMNSQLIMGHPATQWNLPDIQNWKNGVSGQLSFFPPTSNFQKHVPQPFLHKQPPPEEFQRSAFFGNCKNAYNDMLRKIKEEKDANWKKTMEMTPGEIRVKTDLLEAGDYSDRTEGLGADNIEAGKQVESGSDGTDPMSPGDVEDIPSDEDADSQTDYPRTLNNNDESEASMRVTTTEVRGEGVTSVYGQLGNIQGLLQLAAQNAKHQEKQVSSEKYELSSELQKGKSLKQALQKQLEDTQNSGALFLKRFKKEKKLRKKIQEELESASKAMDLYGDAITKIDPDYFLSETWNGTPGSKGPDDPTPLDFGRGTWGNGSYAEATEKFGCVVTFPGQKSSENGQQADGGQIVESELGQTEGSMQDKNISSPMDLNRQKFPFSNPILFNGVAHAT